MAKPAAIISGVQQPHWKACPSGMVASLSGGFFRTANEFSFEATVTGESGSGAEVNG